MNGTTKRYARIAKRLKQVLSGGISALALAAAVFYVAAPPNLSLAMTVGQVSGAQAFDHDAVVIDTSYTLAAADSGARRRAPVETIYVTVTAKVPAKGVRLVIHGIGRRDKLQHATAVLHSSGVNRVRVRLKPGRYRMTISMKVGSKSYARSQQVKLRSHHSYAISITVHEQGIVTTLPFSTY